MFGLALAFTHAGFRRTGRDRLVRENANPQFPFALHAAGQRYARRFDLDVRDPGAFQRLQTELAEIDPEIARSRSLAAAPLGLPVLHPFWHQWHGSVSLKNYLLGANLVATALCRRNTRRLLRAYERRQSG